MIDPRLPDETIDRLLTTLDVRLHAFSICEIGEGTRLLVEPGPLVIAHYVLAGRGLLQVDDGPHQAFGPGTILIGPPLKAQRIVAGDQALGEVLAEGDGKMPPDGVAGFQDGVGAKGDVRLARTSMSATFSGAFGLFDGLSSPLIEDLADIPAARATLEMVLAEQAEPRIGTHAITESLMKQVLVLLVRRHLARAEPASPFFAVKADQRLIRAIALVLGDLAANLNIAALAKAAGMSRSTFAKAFLETFRQTPMDFVQKTRLKQAARLLITTDMPIKSVAAAVGFASRSNFSHAFREVHGVDPTGYREQNATAVTGSAAL